MLKKKTRTQSKNSNKKLTRGFLYEMVFVWNEYVKIQVHLVQKILVRSDSYAFVRNGLPCTKRSLYEVTWHLWTLSHTACYGR